MDEKKAELLAKAIPSLGLPIVRAGVDHYFTKKEMEKEREMQVEVAERQAESARQLMQAKASPSGGGQQTAGGRREPVASDPTADVYDQLENLKRETDCSWCRDMADRLQQASPSEARTGLDELQSYVRESQRIENSDMAEQEAREAVEKLMDRWEVVPKYAAEAV